VPWPLAMSPLCGGLGLVKLGPVVAGSSQTDSATNGWAAKALR
jgi:hypothetical protein